MKIVITTQVRENYGDAERPYWKCKGGSVFVVPNLSVAQTLKVKESGIPALKALIETRNEMFEEFVVDWSILDDDATVCEPWETPTDLFWTGGRWIAMRTIENGEYGYMRREVASKTEEYELLKNGEQGNYKVVYNMRNGDVVRGDQVEAYLKKAA